MSGLYRAGLIVLGVLSIGDLSAPLLTDGEHPPMSIALAGAALGLVSIVLIILARSGRPAPAIGLVVTRIISALTAVPAFFVSGVPPVPLALAGVSIIATLAGAVLVLSGVRRPVPAMAAR